MKRTSYTVLTLTLLALLGACGTGYTNGFTYAYTGHVTHQGHAGCAQLGDLDIERDDVGNVTSTQSGTFRLVEDERGAFTGTLQTHEAAPVGYCVYNVEFVKVANSK